MERAEWLALFTQLDETGWEWPGGWNKSAYHIAERNFLALAADIQQILGERCTVEYGSQIQDASFHGLLALPKICLLDDYIVSLRVSNFGSLATLYDADDFVTPGYRDIIKATLEGHSYVYVPSWVLHNPYYNLKDSGISNWGVRYFDYL